MSMESPLYYGLINAVGVPVSGLLAAGLLSLAYWHRSRPETKTPWIALVAAFTLVFAASVWMIVRSSSWSVGQQHYNIRSLIRVFQPLLKLTASWFFLLAVLANRRHIPPDRLAITRAAAVIFLSSSILGVVNFVGTRLAQTRQTIEILYNVDALLSVCAYSLLATAALAWWRRRVEA